MTALIYYFRKDIVCIAMDSLALDEDNHPLKYVSKFILLPHLHCIICGTGALQFIIKWFTFVQESLVFKNIVDLNAHVQGHLKTIADDLNLSTDLTSTIYHFGLDKLNNEIVGYAYRSKNYFESESLIHSLGIKPDYKEVTQIITEIISQNGIKRGMISLITKLKEHDDKLDLDQKLGIGGEIHFAILNTNRQYCVETIHQFSDYEQIFTEMLENKNVVRTR